jgi:RHS repeat-associated protein
VHLATSAFLLVVALGGALPVQPIDARCIATWVDGELERTLPDGKAWTYEWNGAGMLAKVVRPDGKTVEFGYDALGRRVWKKYGTKTTKWMWDGNVPVHEWVEVDPAVEDPAAQQEAVAWDVGLFDRKHLLSKRSAQGPPPPETSGTSNAPITWVFEPESFAPLAKLTATERFGIVTDHLGTPTAMLDEQGQTAWSADINVYGDLRNVVGEKAACPFRWPGQYEDEETGLYYNRFRYYDPEAGAYVSKDPIGLFGDLNSRSYVQDPLSSTDSRGLACDLPDSHKAEFADGAAFFVPASKWNILKAKLTKMGYADGLFVTSRAEADRLVATGDLASVKKRLGIPSDQWNEPLVRLDVSDPLARNARLPTGNEEGANKLFVPGGHTSGGAPEMVIDPVPTSQLAQSGPYF